MALSVTLRILLCLAITAADTTVCPNLRSATNFAVVAASSVSNTGFTTINGNLGISPSVALTGFNPAGVIRGITELGTGVALQAQNDVTTAYNDCQGAPLTAQMTGIDLAGKTLGPGVYKFDAAAGIDTPAGILTLDGKGIYIFQIGSALATSGNSEIRLINGAKASCIFWQVGSSASLGHHSTFAGNIIAYASVDLAAAVVVNGSIYARTAAISLIAGTVTGQTSCDLC